MRIKPVIYFLLFFLFNQHIYAQHLIVFEENQKESYLVKYSNSPNANEVCTNYFLEELGKHSGKATQYIQYSFSFNELLRITKLTSNSFQANFELKDGSCNGDNKYKGFSLSPALLPSSVDIEAKVLSQKNEFIKSFKLKDIKIEKGFSAEIEMNFEDTLSRNYKLQIENKNFHYNSFSQKRFDKLIDLIDDYYASETKLSLCQEKLQSIHFENVDMLTLYDYTLDDAEKILEHISRRDFPGNLNLEIFDPIHFIAKYNDIANKISEARTQLDKMLSTLDLIYYNKGVDFTKLFNYEKAIPYFEKALQINPLFAPAYYQLAVAYFNENQLSKAAENILFVLNKTRPDYSLLNESKNLAKDIYSAYIALAKQLNSEEKYYEAIDKLDSAKTFCSSSQHIQCNDEIFKTMVVSKKGIYNYYTSIAQKALNTSNSELAEKYAQDAYDFQQLNKEWIKEATEANEILSAVALIYTEKGIKLNQSENYRPALYQLDNAVSICKNHEFINCSDKVNEALNIAHNGIYNSILSSIRQQLNFNQPDLAESLIDTAKSYQRQYPQYIQSSNEVESLLEKAKYQRYTKLIQDGKQFLSINLHESALSNFEKARDLEKNYGFKKEIELAALFQKAAKPLLLEKISDAKVKAWGNDLADAQSMLENIKKLQSLYYLEEDKDVNLAIKELRSKISVRECQNYQDEFDNNISKANQQLKEKAFIYATKFANDALQISSLHVDCKINSTQAQELKSKYEPASSFQQLLQSAEESFDNSNFQKAIDQYMLAIQFYKTKEIEKFNLNIPSLDEWVGTKNNNNFLAYTCNYFYSINEINKAFSMLKQLKTRNYPQNYAIQLQEQIATAMANRDKLAMPLADPKTNLDSYTSNDKWFKYYNKAYLKAWKK